MLPLAGNMNQGKYQPQFQSNLKGNFEVKSPLALQTNINTQILNNVDKMGTDFISTKDNILNNGNGGNISNPYILKEFQKNRNIFTKVGQDSLSK